jgi:chromosome partitioning protein
MDGQAMTPQRPPLATSTNRFARTMVARLNQRPSGQSREQDLKRSERIWTLSEFCRLSGVPKRIVEKVLEHPDAPDLDKPHRDRVMTTRQSLHLRALIQLTHPKEYPSLINWRGKDTQPPVVAAAALKGGTGKSTLAVHLAIGAAVKNGLRVGLIDADGQKTSTFYLSTSLSEIMNTTGATYPDFIAVPKESEVNRYEIDGHRLHSFWRSTPWPGVKLMPAGGRIGMADQHMTVYQLKQIDDDPRLWMRQTLERWMKANPVKTELKDCWSNGRFDTRAFDAGLDETLDLIILDCPPNISLSMIGVLLAADSLVVPQTVKNLDLATLSAFMGSIEEVQRSVSMSDGYDELNYQEIPSFMIATMVNRSADMESLSELVAYAPDVVCPVYYPRSDAVSNPAATYDTFFSHKPDRNRREGHARFMKIIHEVNDAILPKICPWVPATGEANEFIRREYVDENKEVFVPDWN